MQPDGRRLHYLLHSADLVEERLSRQFAPLGIKPRQARILDALARMDLASQVDLAREFNVSPASMSTMTARLVAAGFITRDADPDDPRRNTLRLSRKGHKLLEQVHSAWLAVDEMIERVIGADKAAKLAKLALELRNALGGRTPGRSTAEGRDRPW